MELVVRLARLSNAFSRMIQNAGDLATYQNWLKSSFGSADHYVRRETLWKSAIANSPEGPMTFIEFGVARGYIGHYFYDNFLKERNFRWFGFDTFTGLPRDWRDNAAGTFSADGAVPSLPQHSFSWYKGLVEDTLTDAVVDRIFGLRGPKFIFFDFDLREPTEFALRKITHHLQVGDFLYFDEAFDNDERSAISYLLEGDRKFDVFGATALSVMLRVAS